MCCNQIVRDCQSRHEIITGLKQRASLVCVLYFMTSEGCLFVCCVSPQFLLYTQHTVRKKGLFV